MELVKPCMIVCSGKEFEREKRKMFVKSIFM
jgi:hypothetical protein